MQLYYAQLKATQRKYRDKFPLGLGLRTHRSLSWLQRAEQEQGDDDARFIFLWIAFNVAYAHEIDSRNNFSERRLFLKFLNQLIKSDRNNLLYEIIWTEFSGSIRLLIENKFVSHFGISTMGIYQKQNGNGNLNTAKLPQRRHWASNKPLESSPLC